MITARYVCFVLIVCGYAYLGGIYVAYANDPANDEIAIAQEKKEVAGRYSCLTGKDPNRMNLIQSISRTNVRGRCASEVVAALDLIRLSEKGTNLVGSVDACYQQNPYWLVRVKCVETLSVLDETKADELAHAIIADSSFELEARLLIAKLMLKRGKLYGYPVLREGLVSTNKYQQRMAAELMDGFEKYDGQAYDKGSGKINVRELRSAER